MLSCYTRWSWRVEAADLRTLPHQGAVPRGPDPFQDLLPGVGPGPLERQKALGLNFLPRFQLRPQDLKFGLSTRD